MEIINYCPRCGAPIYGKKEIENTEQPEIKRTCSCFGKSPPKSILDGIPKKDIKDTMHTK